MRKFYSSLGVLLMGATSLFAQTNYTVTFSANVEMEKVQVKNLSSGETKMLYSPDNVITLQKNEKTAVETLTDAPFLQQTAQNVVVVSLEKSSQLNLTLYSANGNVVTRYSNIVNAGQTAFQVGATAGTYVLVATSDNHSASQKISVTKNSQIGIIEVAKSEPVTFLKSIDDMITFDEGDKFEFTGYYYNQTDLKTAVITANKTITFSFTKVTAPTVSTVQATNITTDAATVGGNVTKDNGTTVTERGVCWSTKSNPTISDNKKVSGKGTGSFSVSLSSLAEETTYYVRAYAVNSIGIEYGNEITFTTKKVIIGAIKFAFSVSKNKKVYFSKGNLQYKRSSNTWKFAENQYDTIGNVTSNYSWSGIDLFGWGTSGWDSGAIEYQPYSTSSYGSDYWPGGSYTNSLTGNYANADWGVYNKISNGGNQAGLWRTLTESEWTYLISSRVQANRLRGLGTVNGVKGLILLPDGCELPLSVEFTPTIDDYSTTKNVYSQNEWTVMESYGAVFLPAVRGRNPKAISYGSWGWGSYWTSSAGDNSGAPYLSFGPGRLICYYYCGHYEGLSVRLVHDVE